MTHLAEHGREGTRLACGLRLSELSARDDVTLEPLETTCPRCVASPCFRAVVRWRALEYLALAAAAAAAFLLLWRYWRP